MTVPGTTTPVCSPSNTCVPCAIDGDCPGDMVCDAASGRCLEC